MPSYSSTWSTERQFRQEYVQPTAAVIKAPIRTEAAAIFATNHADPKILVAPVKLVLPDKSASNSVNLVLPDKSASNSVNLVLPDEIIPAGASVLQDESADNLDDFVLHNEPADASAPPDDSASADEFVPQDDLMHTDHVPDSQ